MTVRESKAFAWQRVPHQFILAFTFSALGLGLAALLITNAHSSILALNASVSYDTAELEGIHYLEAAHKALYQLLAYRSYLSERSIDARRPGPSGAPPDAADHDRVASISASIAQISDPLSTQTPLDKAIAGRLGILAARWRAIVQLRHPTPSDLTAAIATVQPVLVDISGASGITNDPQIDGINFGDAIVRLSQSAASGLEAASLAHAGLIAHALKIAPRFIAARLLAQAEAAAEVGLQDAHDEETVDPVLAAPLERAAERNLRNFDELQNIATTSYVEALSGPRGTGEVPALVRAIDRFRTSSAAAFGVLRTDLFGVVQTRIERAREQRTHVLLTLVGSLALEASTLLAMAWISIVSYRNQRKHMSAERTQRELQRLSLEAQLTQAKAEQALLQVKAEFRAVFDRAPTGMLIVDRQRNVSDINEAAQAMFDPGDSSVTATDIVTAYADILDQMYAEKLHVHSEERAFVAADRSRWLHVLISPVYNSAGAPAFAVFMLRDITDGKTMEAQLVFDAEHDALTGLPNRKSFLALLQQALDNRSRAAQCATFSVVFIDLNDFKTINDSFGHQAGDIFLVNAGAKLQGCVRSSDVVARIGGDEFAILLHGTTRADIEKSASRLQAVISTPVNIEGQLLATSASLGIAHADANYSVAAEIIRDADTAMYQAKAGRRREHVVFDTTMREKVVHRMQLSIDLVRALDHNELELFYQPIVDLQTGRIAGCEALIRWRRSDGSIVSPTDFLPLAEENGSIIEIGSWVTRTACEQLRMWNEAAQAGRLPGFDEHFVMHVNLAVPEVHQIDLLANLQRALATSMVGRHQIMLEITEGIILKNTQHTHSMLDAVTADGFRLCIDDFGTGYSSLRYLNELPLHSFKIDKSFVSNGTRELANTSIVEMLMVLSRSLGLLVVAEGIETPEQWQMLRDLDCPYGQGYLFAKALEAPALTALLQKNAPLGKSVATDCQIAEPISASCRL